METKHENSLRKLFTFKYSKSTDDYLTNRGGSARLSVLPSTKPKLGTSNDSYLYERTLLAFTQEETIQFHKTALVKLNELLPKNCLISNDWLKKYHEQIFDLKFSWFPWRKSLAVRSNGLRKLILEPPKFIFKTSLMSTIEHVSAPFDSTDLLARKRNIPVILSECGRFLKKNVETVGIFRVSGSDKRISKLAASFDQAPDFGRNLKFDGYNVYDVADCLKKYLRSLPEPLLTTHMYPLWIKTNGIDEQIIEILKLQNRLKCLKILMMMLPKSHLIALEYILSLLRFTAAFCEKNQMDVKSISKIFAPTLLWPKSPATQAMNEYDLCAKVIETMIEYPDVFEISKHSLAPTKVMELDIVT